MDRAPAAPWPDESNRLMGSVVGPAIEVEAREKRQRAAENHEERKAPFHKRSVRPV